MNAGHPWLTAGVRAPCVFAPASSRREPQIKSALPTTSGVKVRKNFMPVHRRRFRIEQALVGEVPTLSTDDGDADPMHREIMSELRAIRAQMGRPVNDAGSEAIGEA